jgi:hypothetical protein
MVTPRRISKSGIVLMEVFLVVVRQFDDAGMLGLSWSGRPFFVCEMLVGKLGLFF